MAVYKCKMCSAPISVSDETTVVECEYCNSTQTLPSDKDEVITNLFNRANHLRINSEFDKAADIYSKILDENAKESEAYWGLVLCKYGIEYVLDPKTQERIPTCHRTQYTSVLTDSDYVSAIENSDPVRRDVYMSQAAQIADLQKAILEIVKNEKPFDVFICYKETDSEGKRTVDSTLANDIYYQLTKEGLRVFYAAITLEDKLGREYEPYIFAALNSAKVMLALGTKPEYFNAVWVKNEWSRYLSIMKNDRDKLIIPCYRDMDAYDLPEEFAHLQAQDMSKIGFVSDLVRGIRKIIDKEDNGNQTVVKQTVVAAANTAGTAPLLKRAYMFLEDGEWGSADEYAEKVLDIDPECAEAYLAKLMTQLRVREKENLKNCDEPFDSNILCKKVMRFGNDELKKEIEEINLFINNRNRHAALTELYAIAKEALDSADTENEFLSARNKFEEIGDFEDAPAQAELCAQLARNHRERIGSAIREIHQYSINKARMAEINSANAELNGKLKTGKETDEQIMRELNVTDEAQVQVRLDALQSEYDGYEAEKSGIQQTFEAQRSELKSQDFFALKKKFGINKDIKKTTGQINEIEAKQASIRSEQERIKGLMTEKAELAKQMLQIADLIKRNTEVYTELEKTTLDDNTYSQELKFLRRRSFNEVSAFQLSPKVLNLLDVTVIKKFPLQMIAETGLDKIRTIYRDSKNAEELYTLAMLIKEKQGWTSSADFLISRAVELDYAPALYEKGIVLKAKLDLINAYTCLGKAADEGYKDAACLFADVALNYIELDKKKLERIKKNLSALKKNDSQLYDSKNGAALMKEVQNRIDKIVAEEERIKREKAKAAAKEAKRYSSYSSSSYSSSSSCACNGSGGCY